MKTKIYILFSLLFVFNLIEAQTYRYTESIFPNVTKIADVVYGNAAFLNSSYNDENATTNGNLVMDIYEPTGDTRTDRPAIVFAHGGGFADGNRNVDDMEAFCDSFASKGYVTVTIDYRQGVEVLDNGNLHYTRAAYRGLQDGRTAIRFLRANAATYGIDATKIYWGGNSAGSFIGLNAIYMDAEEKPAYAGAVNYSIGMIPFSGPDLGDLDIGNNLSENGEPDAVMACWGGVADTTIQMDADNNQNVFLIHGTTDGIVPFNSGAPFGLSGINPVYGSNSINTRLTNLDIPAQMTYFVPGQDHEFYGVDNGDWENGTNGNEYWDTVVVKATKFYHDQFKPTADYNFTLNGLTTNFTDNSSDAISYIWNFGDGSSQIYTQNTNHTYAVAGSYNVRLYVENSQANWDTITQVITVETPMSGTYSIGFGSSNDYSTLYHALQDLNNRGADAPVVFELASDYNPSSEAYPIAIRPFYGATYSYTLTIKPATGTSHIFSRNAASIFTILGATHVIIDGSNNGTNSRDLTISNISADDNTSGISLIDNPSAGYDITIKNCIIKGGTKEHVTSGIFSNNFVDVTIENNKILRARTGVYTIGNTISVINNEIGSDADNEYLHYGISVESGYDINIKGNNIFNLIDSQDFDAIHAIALNNITGNAEVSSNFIDNLLHTGNEVVQAIAFLNCNPTNFKIFNNRISNIASNSFDENYPAGIAIKCPAMINGMNIEYNSINIPQNLTYGIGTVADYTMVGGINIGAGTGITLKNNIISNKLGERNGATFTTIAAGIIVNSTTSPFTENDNNLFYADGTDYNYLGFNPNGALTLDNWQTWTSGATNSFFNEALFISDNDLNLQACSPAVAHASYNAEYNIDIESNTRDTQYPTMGAYEYEKVQASNLIQVYPVKETGWVMLSWQKGTGCKSITFMKEGDFLSSPPSPVNGVTYMADYSFGLGTEIGSTGWFCVANDNSNNTFNETTVVKDQQYTVMVCEYFGTSGNEIYLTESSTNNPILVTGDNSGDVEEINSQSIKIKPNPTTGKVILDFSKISNFGIVGNIDVSDITGKNIYSTQYSTINNQLNLDLSELESGIYFIKIKSNSQSITKKLIIR